MVATSSGAQAQGAAFELASWATALAGPVLAWLVSLARRVLARPAVRRRMEQVSALVMVGFGVRLAVERLSAAIAEAAMTCGGAG